MKWITARQLEDWADRTDARTALSELVSALVRASAQDIQSYRFPAGDSAQIPGYDGHLVAKGVAPYVPDGESIWEFGTDKKYQAKANEDIETRSKNPGAVNPKDATFVFVTPRVWKAPISKPKKKATKNATKAPPKRKAMSSAMSIQEWTKAKRTKGPWKAVVVIDGVKLEAWLEAHPAVAAHFARYVLEVFPPGGVLSVTEYWDTYAVRFNPNIVEGVLLSGRDKQAAEIVRQLIGTPSIHSWRAYSPDEVVAFTVAAIRRADPETRRFIESRTLVVRTEEAAQALSVLHNMAFIAERSAATSAGMLAKNGPTIVPLGRYSSAGDDAHVLQRSTAGEMGKAIAEMGVSEEDAYRWARECGCSVTILMRQRPSATASDPPWADGTTTLIPALLGGAWDSGNAEDAAIIASLAGAATYDDYEREIRHLARLEDPPLDHVGSVWTIRAPVDAFAYLAHLVGTSELKRFETALTQVFSSLDPQTDPSRLDQPFDPLQRVGLPHSEWLRDGLATTLLLIAALGEKLGLTMTAEHPQALVDRVIAKLPGLSSNARLLASLGAQLPLLMEAAPRPLVEALERLLGGRDQPLALLFREHRGLLAPSSAHTNLLFALETLAWDPEFLLKSVNLLAGLAAIDPGGNLQNRPINSLAQILMPWNPNTNANIDLRLTAIDAVCQRGGATGWDLVTRLLPTWHAVGQETSKPRYRDAGASERDVLMWDHVFRAYRRVIEWGLDLAGADAERWKTLVSGISQYEPALQTRTLDVLEEHANGADEPQRDALWLVLKDEVAHQEEFIPSERAETRAYIDRLRRLLGELTPTNPLVRAKWLFDEVYPSGYLTEASNEPETLERDRRRAIEDVVEKFGVAGLLRLAESVEYPGLIPRAAADFLPDVAEVSRLASDAVVAGKRQQVFAMALSAWAEGRYDGGWLEALRDLTKSLSAESITTLLLGFPEIPDTWNLAASFGAEIELGYWQRKQIWPLYMEGADGRAVLGVSDVERACRHYLAADRATAAVDSLGSRTRSLPEALVLEILDEALREISRSKSPPNNMFVFHVEQIFKELNLRTDVSLLEVAKREYAYLPLRPRFHRSDLALHRIMAEDGAFFVSVIADVFRAASGEAPSERELTPVQRGKASAAYELLRSFVRVPGQEGDAIDKATLGTWIARVQEQAAAVDRVRIVDQFIGHVLAHAPADPQDGAWPHLVVREVLEEVKSDDVERGVATERFNMRGVFSKALFGGGDDERAIAAQFAAWAKTVKRWHRTAAVLKRLASTYRQMAADADVRAEQDRMRA